MNEMSKIHSQNKVIFHFEFWIMIIASSFVLSSPSLALCPEQKFPEFAFIGRSNVGKSTLINNLCNKKWLAKVSDKPGKTQLINYFLVTSKDEEGNKNQWNLVDLPWYGYAKVSKTQRYEREDMIGDYLINRPLSMIFVLIDSSISVQKVDLQFLNRLDKHNKPYTIVFTKSDKVKQKELHANLKNFVAELQQQVTTLPGYFVTSAEKKFSTQDLLKAIEEIAKI